MQESIQQAIQTQLTTFLVEELLSPQAGQLLESTDDLLGGGLVDSLGIMRLIAFVEQTHGINVPPGDVTIDNFRTIETIVHYIQGRII